LPRWQMVTTGARNEDECRLAARKVAKIVRKLGGNASFKDFRIQNIVGTGGVNFPVRLEGLADEHGRMSSVRCQGWEWCGCLVGVMVVVGQGGGVASRGCHTFCWLRIWCARVRTQG
jgi:hypothetical protein